MLNKVLKFGIDALGRGEQLFADLADLNPQNLGKLVNNKIQEDMRIGEFEVEKLKFAVNDLKTEMKKEIDGEVAKVKDALKTGVSEGTSGKTDISTPSPHLLHLLLQPISLPPHINPSFHFISLRIHRHYQKLHSNSSNGTRRMGYYPRYALVSSKTTLTPLHPMLHAN